ncbi:MAG TPA: multicopper oxidase family protein [Aeromicrobium sp.]|nr:multicopper oxidase family protein [Aeromicrobium sp.]
MNRRRVRLLLALGASLAILLPVGWIWQASLLPASYSAMDMGFADYGGGPRSHPHEHTGEHAGAIDVSDLTEKVTGEPDVRVTLVARASTVKVAGQAIDGFTLNGRTPGPRIVVREGDLVHVTLRNESVTDGVSLHWHGVDVPNAEDGVAGVTQNAVRPGGEHVYRFVARQTGTFWYHSHQVSHEQVAGGLFGSLVVLPRGGIEQAGDVTAIAHTYGGNRTLNGRATDTVVRARAGETMRVRVINTDNGVLATWATGPYRLLAVDGTDLSEPSMIRDRRIDVPAGGRADLGVTVPKSGGVTVFVGAATRLQIVGTGDDGEPAHLSGAPPTQSVDLMTYGKPPASGASEPTPDRVFDYSIGRRPGFLDGKPGFWWTVNGRMFPDVPMFTVREGDVVKFRVENHSGETHPMHLHGHHARIVSIDGRRSSGSPVWVDSVDVRDGHSVDLVFRADNPGIWMDHCHNLPHANEGLVAHLMYEGVTTRYRIGGPGRNAPE